MPKVRGLLRPRPKVDAEEMALAESRTVARLAVLLGDSPAADKQTAPAGDASPGAVEREAAQDIATPPSAPAARRRARSRPPIVVEGAPDTVGRRVRARPSEPVGVMAPSRDDLGASGWNTFLADVGQHAPDPDLPVPPSADETVVEAERVAESSTATPTSSVHRRPRLDGPARSPRGRPAAERVPASRTTRVKARSAPVPAAFCPYCAVALEPPPASSRRCERCRQRIVVKRVDDRTVYLTEAALLVFEAERRRVASSGRLTRERDRWLRLAAESGAPPQAQARLVAALLTEEVVGAARALYLSTADRAFKAAKRDRDWASASRIRREQATAMFRAARSPSLPPAEIVALFREGVAAELRRVSEISRDAELVSATCCDVCRADDRRTFRIAHELRTPRLPHEGCPRVFCRCRWDLAARDRTTMRRYLRRRPRAGTRAATSPPAPSS